jgi:hypothetical protein
MENFTFQPINPHHSNWGLECDSKYRKCGPRSTLLRSSSRPCLQLSNGYPKLISYFEMKNFTFQPTIPLCSKSGLECDPQLRKCSPKNYTSPLAIKTTFTILKWVSKFDFIFGNKEFYFSAHNPTSFKLGPGM